MKNRDLGCIDKTPQVQLHIVFLPYTVLYICLRLCEDLLPTEKMYSGPDVLSNNYQKFNQRKYEAVQKVNQEIL